MALSVADPRAKETKDDRVRLTLGGPYSVIRARVEATGEDLPTLVQAATWLPLPLASRWVITERRYVGAANTIANDLSGLRFLYGWADTALPAGLEDVLLTGGRLSPVALTALALHLRAAGGTSAPSYARATGMFLKWALQPANRGQSGAAPDDLLLAYAQIDAVLGPIAAERRVAVRPRILPDEERIEIEQRIGPVRDTHGRVRLPLMWHPQNPFKPNTRLRNFLLWCLALDLGLRLSEMLKLRLEDINPRGYEPGVLRVVRRPDDPQDQRSRRPSVKTLERLLPLTPTLELLLKLYLQLPAPAGRVRSVTPYLITGRSGCGLSISQADTIPDHIWRSLDLQPFAFHALRHTWAESLAAALLTDDEDHGLAMEKLRVLGGWSLTSQMPAYYCQLALGRAARRWQRERQMRLERVGMQ